MTTLVDPRRRGQGAFLLGTLLLSVLAALVAAWAVTGSALASQPAAPAGPLPVRVVDPWARPSIATGMDAHAPFGMTAAYFVLENDGDVAVTLVGVSTDVSETAELHESSVVHGVASMHPAGRIVVPAHGRVGLEPGGFHVMLPGLRRALKEGDSFTLTLIFEGAPALAVVVPVVMR